MRREYRYGTKIQELRRERGWTQEHLAEVAGLEVRTIQRVESDSTRAAETLLAIAAAFDVPIHKIRTTYLVCESHLVGRHFITSSADFVRTEETWSHHSWTKSVLVPSEAKELAQLEDRLAVIFSDREVIEPDDMHLWSSYVSSIIDPLDSLFSEGFAFFVLDENRDLMLPRTADLTPQKPYMSDWRTRHYFLVARHSCFQSGGTGPLHRFDAGCKSASDEILGLAKGRQEGLLVYGNALCAVKKEKSEAAIPWCEFCFPKSQSGIRVGFTYLEAVIPTLLPGELTKALGKDREMEFLQQLLGGDVSEGSQA